MKTLMITAATLALAAPAFAQTATQPLTETAPVTETAPMTETAPTDGMATGTMTTDTMTTDTMATGTMGASMEMTRENPGISASWLEDRPIYTTNQPSTTAWDDNANWGTSRPADWNEIGEIEDIVLSSDGQVIGYTADVGGFLGLGERTVMLTPDMVRLVDFDDAVMWGDTTVFVTNYTQEELEALPEFDDDMLLDD